MDRGLRASSDGPSGVRGARREGGLPGLGRPPRGNTRSRHWPQQLGSDRRDHTIGVAPSPVVIPEVPSEVVVEHTDYLDATASHDVFGARFATIGKYPCSPFLCTIVRPSIARSPLESNCAPHATSGRFFCVENGDLSGPPHRLSDRHFGGHESN